MALCRGIKLFEDGERLFLTTKERHQFRKAIESMDNPQRSFCRLLYYTGCKLSEGLKLFPSQIDAENGTIILGKSGGRLKERSIPVPPALQIDFSIHFPLSIRVASQPLWSMSRAKGWRIINEAMNLAGISGKYATSTGLRHSYAISCLELWPKITLTQIQEWLGHRSFDLTLSYLKAFTHADECINQESGILEALWNHL